MIRALRALGRLVNAAARLRDAGEQLDVALWDVELNPVDAHAEMACALLCGDSDYLPREGKS